MSKRTSSTPSVKRELPRDFRLADAGRTREQERADGAPLVAQARAGHLDGGRQRADRAILAEDDELQIALDVAQHVAIRGGDVLRRNPRDLRDDGLDEVHVDDARPRALGLQAAIGAGLVDDVDGLVGQMAIVDVLRRQLRGGASARHPSTRCCDAPRTGSSARAGSRRSRRPTAPSRRSSGNAARARDPSRRCRGTRV